jgi:hypothetical protein
MAGLSGDPSLLDTMHRRACGEPCPEAVTAILPGIKSDRRSEPLHNACYGTIMQRLGAYAAVPVHRSEHRAILDLRRFQPLL